MRDWLLAVLIFLLFNGLILLIYKPVYQNDHTVVTQRHDHPEDSVQEGIEGEITFCSDEWPPYVYASGSRHEGYAVDLLREIYEPLGFKVTMEIMPWSFCLHKGREGAITGVVGSGAVEASGFFLPEMAIGVYQPQFYSLQGLQWSYQGIESLSEVHVGVAQDYSYSDQMEAYIEMNKQSDRLIISKGETPLRVLMNYLEEGVIDVFVENRFTVDALLTEVETTGAKLRVAGRLPTDERLYVAFSPRDQRTVELAKRFDRRLENLRKGGVFAEILGEYGLEDWHVNSSEKSQSRLGEKP